MNPYSSLCDDFGVYVYLNSKMELPAGRETILHFFDSLQKTFPQMTDFDCRENGEYVLEENREQGSYRWVTLETRQVRTGQFPEAPISVYFTVRQYWGRQPFKTFGDSYKNQRRICQELVDSHIVPGVVRPLAQAIAAKQ